MASTTPEPERGSSSGGARNTVKAEDEVERPTSAPSQSSRPKKLANAYRFNRLSIRRRAKYLLRKHQKRMTKENKEKQATTTASSCPSPTNKNNFIQVRHLKNDAKAKPAAAQEASASSTAEPTNSRRSYSVRGRARQLRSQTKKHPPMFGGGKVSPMSSLQKRPSSSSAAAVAPISVYKMFDFDDDSSSDSHSRPDENLLVSLKSESR